ncbi:MAG TPA: hypothetical protein VKG25_08070 [Bryobacteraceae bacterium]|nr:hypothetical protein [Bryobacteraceae bacterium]
MRKKAMAIALFLLCLLLVSFSATPYAKTADMAVIAVRFTLVIAVSVLVIREKWRNRDGVSRNPDAGNDWLQWMRRWFTGDT